MRRPPGIDPNYYDSVIWVPADPGIYKSSDYALLASVVGSELVDVDDVKFTTVFSFSGDGDRSACSWRVTSSSPFWRTPGGARGGLQTGSSGSLGWSGL